MWRGIRSALTVLIFLLANVVCSEAQLRLERTVKPNEPAAAPNAARQQPDKPPEAKPAQIVVRTSPNAEVYLDNQFAGRASPEGRLVIGNVTPGDHKLRVSLAGMQNYEQKLTVLTGQMIEVAAGPGRRADRNYYDFTLPHVGAQQEIGTVVIELVETNPEKQLFTLILYFDEKVQKPKDMPVKQPIHFHPRGASRPLEVVVDKLREDSVSGYLSAPKGFFPGHSSEQPVGAGQPSGTDSNTTGAKGAAPRLIRIDGEVAQAKLIFHPIPEYPALAKLARIQGLVRLETVIGTDGTVEGLKVLSGHPLLAKAAIKAVSRWRYQPTVLNGEPVEVVTEIYVTFTLQE